MKKVELNHTNMPIKLYDSFKKDSVEFKPIKNKKVGLYSCGPTVYDYVHIGNLRTFIFNDILKRSLQFLGYKVKHVMNITDVGHLSSDEDEGEDKLEQGARREKKKPEEISAFYTEAFLNDVKALNIDFPDKLPRATDHIKQMIKTVEALVEREIAYETEQAVYFDVTKFPDYEKLIGQKLEDRQQAVREEVVPDKDKKNPADFALWFKTVDRFKNHTQRWGSPWGEGFPGWHIECSAMSREYLGQPFDIHTGGTDLKFLHHPNEIAQSAAAYGKPLANYWLHGEFLLVKGQKMSKSLGNLYTLDDIKKKGFSPLEFRYLMLTSHYQNRLNFTWEGLKAAARAYSNLKVHIQSYEKASKPDKEYLEKFKQALENNLDIPGALAVLWELVKVKGPRTDVKRATINEMDKVLGLELSKVKPLSLPSEVERMVQDREKARKKKDWETSDKIRKQIEEKGYTVEDTQKGPVIKAKK